LHKQFTITMQGDVARIAADQRHQVFTWLWPLPFAPPLGVGVPLPCQ
jgi:hypothetical protein